MRQGSMVCRPMGLLDDAIREHLELKRRRGADLGEVAREEREALDDPIGAHRALPDEVVAPAGEPRLASEATPPGAGPDVSGTPVFDAARVDDGAYISLEDPGEASGAGISDVLQETAEMDMRSVLDQHPGAARPDEMAPGSTGAAAGEAGLPAGVSAEDSPGEASEEDSLEWEVPGEAVSRPASDAVHHEGAASADDTAGEGYAQASADDVLEETPDFLRDTPEQERLWFEQNPPRDFDFDK